MARYPTVLDQNSLETELFKALNKFEARFRRNYSTGNPSRYEVHFDKVREIGPTSDPNEFADVLDFVEMGTTKEIDIRIYHSASRNNDQYVLYLNGKDPNRVGHDEQIKSDVRKEIGYEQMEKDFALLKKEYAELDTYSDQISEELEKYRKKKLYLGDVNLVEVGGMLLEGFVKRNPHIISGLTGGHSLAGAIDSVPQTDTQPDGEDESSISRADEEENPGLEILNQIQSAFTQDQFESVMRILDVLSLCPDKIPHVLSTLENTTQPVNL